MSAFPGALSDSLARWGEHGNRIAWPWNGTDERIYLALRGYREIKRRPAVPHPMLRCADGDAVRPAKKVQ